MSAFIVDRCHIRLLVRAAESLPERHASLSWVWGINRDAGTYERRALTPCGPGGEEGRCTPEELGQLLWDENVASVSYRYGGESRDTLPGPVGEDYVYVHRGASLAPRPDPVRVLKACDCYEYQSCEHPGWSASEARAALEAIRSAAIHALPGYDAAPWGEVEYGAATEGRPDPVSVLSLGSQS